MFSRIVFILGWLRRLKTSRSDVLIENLGRGCEHPIGSSGSRSVASGLGGRRPWWSSGPTRWCAGTARSRRTSHAWLRRFRAFDPEARQRWRIQQLREAFPFDSAPRYLVFDNDKSYGTEVLAVIVLNERHLHRRLSELLAYYHDDRTHRGLGKSTPSMRTATSKPNRDAAIVGHPRVGGLQHRYEWRQAA